MCCIFTCFTWFIDLLQRCVTFTMSCVISAAVCCGILVSIMAGVALGYNYSLTEYIDLKDTNVSVYLKRGIFDDDVGDMLARRSGDLEEPQVQIRGRDDKAFEEPLTEAGEKALRTGGSLDKSIYELEDNRRYEGSLLKLTVKTDSATINYPNPSYTPDVQLSDERRPVELMNQYKDYRANLLQDRKSLERVTVGHAPPEIPEDNILREQKPEGPIDKSGRRDSMADYSAVENNMPIPHPGSSYRRSGVENLRPLQVYSKEELDNLADMNVSPEMPVPVIKNARKMEEDIIASSKAPREFATRTLALEYDTNYNQVGQSLDYKKHNKAENEDYIEDDVDKIPIRRKRRVKRSNEKIIQTTTNQHSSNHEMVKNEAKDHNNTEAHSIVTNNSNNTTKKIEYRAILDYDLKKLILRKWREMHSSGEIKLNVSSNHETKDHINTDAYNILVVTDTDNNENKNIGNDTNTEALSFLIVTNKSNNTTEKAEYRAILDDDLKKLILRKWREMHSPGEISPNVSSNHETKDHINTETYKIVTDTDNNENKNIGNDVNTEALNIVTDTDDNENKNIGNDVNTEAHNIVTDTDNNENKNIRNDVNTEAHNIVTGIDNNENKNIGNDVNTEAHNIVTDTDNNENKNIGNDVNTEAHNIVTGIDNNENKNIGNDVNTEAHNIVTDTDNNENKNTGNNVNTEAHNIVTDTDNNENKNIGIDVNIKDDHDKKQLRMKRRRRHRKFKPNDNSNQENLKNEPKDPDYPKDNKINLEANDMFSVKRFMFSEVKDYSDGELNFRSMLQRWNFMSAIL